MVAESVPAMNSEELGVMIGEAARLEELVLTERVVAEVLGGRFFNHRGERGFRG